MTGGEQEFEDLDLLHLVAQGMTDEQIARRLGISVSTLQRRLRTAAERLGASSRINLALRAAREAVLAALRPFVGDDLNPSASAEGTEPDDREQDQQRKDQP